MAQNAIRRRFIKAAAKGADRAAQSVAKHTRNSQGRVGQAINRAAQKVHKGLGYLAKYGRTHK